MHVEITSVPDTDIRRDSDAASFYIASGDNGMGNVKGKMISRG